MFDTTRGQRNNWRWETHPAFGQKWITSIRSQPSRGKVKPNRKYFSWYGIDDLRAKIQPRSCRQYKAGSFLAVGPLNWDKIIDKDDDNENWVDPRAQSGARSRPGDGNDDDDGERKEATQGCEKSIGKGKGKKDGKGTGKGKVKGNAKGKGIVKQTLGEMISLVQLLCSCTRNWLRQTRTGRAN
jgi:hypothetical protein